MGMSGMYGPADERESIATIHAALDQGITLLDTGDSRLKSLDEQSGSGPSAGSGGGTGGSGL